MPETEKKKRRSGRARDESDESGSTPAADDAKEKLQQPWLPLFWLLIPLMASVAYGLATRGH
ncbi:MAG: hypothetical protein L6Q84_23050 [Polyangiaceae bacterium]|nr:hypothetical protein [Polyangiaceae bacterium]